MAEKPNTMWVRTLPGVKQPTYETMVLRTGVPALIPVGIAKKLIEQRLVEKCDPPKEAKAGIHVPLKMTLNGGGAREDAEPAPPIVDPIVIEIPPGCDLIEVPEIGDRAGYKLWDKDTGLVVMPDEKIAELIESERGRIPPEERFLSGPVKVVYTKGHAKAPRDDE